jgi:hypothetical protein
MSQLEKLALSLDDFAISGDLENLGSNLGKLTFLRSLKIDIPNIDFISFDDIAKFCKGILNLHLLQDFSFNYGHLHPHSSMSLKSVIKQFSSMRHLHHFQLAEWSVAQRNNDDLLAILESDPQLSEKGNLFIELKPYDINTYRLIQKVNSLSTNTNLRRLNISAPECLDLESGDLVELLSSLYDAAPEINDLKLDLMQCTGLKADSFSNVIAAINRFTLKSLALNLDKTNLSDDCMMSFADLLHFQKNLQVLDMGLGAFGGSTPVGLIYFYQELGRLYNLKNLKVCHELYVL